jgi:hypothetical protein
VKSVANIFKKLVVEASNDLYDTAEAGGRIKVAPVIDPWEMPWD